MHWINLLISRLRGLFRREAVLKDIEEEIRLHVDMEAQASLKLGLKPEEAQARALRLFGNLDLIKDRAYDVRGGGILETLWQDARYSVRMMKNKPGFTLIAVVTLALGIGASVAIFSVVHAVLLRPLPYPWSERLVMVWERVRLPNYQNERNAPAPGNFEDWRKQSSAFHEMAAVSTRNFNLTGEGEPVRIDGAAVSAAFFSVLQTDPALGRAFTAAEDRPDAPRVVVLSHGLWTSRFGADQQICGKTILLDGESYTVLGVMPTGFRFPDLDDQIWVTLALGPNELADHGSHKLQVIARLKDGVALAQAQAEMNTIAEKLTAQYPNTNTGVGVNLVPLHEQVVRDVRPALVALLAVTGFILLIVCANVGNLLLVRATARQRELAIRLALGAAKSRVVRQLLTESLLLSLVGGALALALAYAGVRGLRALSPPDLPRVAEIGLNGSVLAFSLAVSAITGIVFGIAPALQAWRQDMQGFLKEGARNSPPGSRIVMRNLLAAAEITLSVIVLVGAGLLLRSFVHLAEVRLGFEPQNVLTQRVILRGSRYTASSQRTTFYQQAIQRIESLSGVKSAAAVSYLPLINARNRAGFSIEGRANTTPGQVPFAVSRIVTPGYFQTMQIGLLKGRDFAWQDLPQTEQVIVVNQAMASAYWPNEDALGKRIKFGPPDAPMPWLTVAGIVEDIREFDPITQPLPTLYMPASQSGSAVQDWVVRTAGDPLSLAAAVRSAIWEIDNDLAVSRVRSMDGVCSAATSAPRFNLILMGFFACLALALAVTGVYGVTAYSVGQRTREIGVRMALGARGGDVIRLALAQSLKVIAVGVALGLAGALALTRFMTSLLFGVSPSDPATFAAISLLLVGVALLACYIPAHRAIKVDPLVALHYE